MLHRIHVFHETAPERRRGAPGARFPQHCHQQCVDAARLRASAVACSQQTVSKPRSVQYALLHGVCKAQSWFARPSGAARAGMRHVCDVFRAVLYSLCLWAAGIRAQANKKKKAH